MKKLKGKLQKGNPKVLITGINGFVGSHLTDLLVSEDYQVAGIDLIRDQTHLSKVPSPITVWRGDVCDVRFIEEILAEIKPDYIYHLAGSAFVPDADADPRSVYTVNVLGTLNLLEAVRSARLDSRVLIVGSGEVYGPVPEEQLPVKEEYPLRPTTPYGVTKACADLLGYQYAATYKMNVIRVRSFNHTGPGQSEQFVCSAFAKQIVEIEKSIRKPILNVGNLEARRDFTDVRDVVRAYRLVLEGAQECAVYNVGSGKAWRIGDLLKILVRQSTVRDIKIQEQKARVRSNDVPVMICNASKLERDWGWKAEIPIEQTFHDLLDYWRENVKQHDSLFGGRVAIEEAS